MWLPECKFFCTVLTFPAIATLNSERLLAMSGAVTHTGSERSRESEMRWRLLLLGLAAGGALAAPVSGQSPEQLVHRDLHSDQRTALFGESALTLKLTLPLDGQSRQQGSHSLPRLTLGVSHMDWKGTARETRFAFGMDVSGDGVFEAGQATFQISELSAALAADEEGETQGSGATPWIVGGVVLVGVFAVAANELTDDFEDIGRCINDLYTGGDCAES